MAVSTQDKLYQITLDYACFGILVCDDYVIAAAPIGKWMIGKTIYQIESWVNNKNGRLDYIDL
jgi:hypothetical protein